MHFSRRQPQFVGEVIAACEHTAQDIAHFWFVVNESQQRFTSRTLLTNAQYILGRRVEADDQQVLIQQDDAGA